MPGSTWITATSMAGLIDLLYRSLHAHIHEPAGLDAARLRAAVLADINATASTLRSGF